MYTDQERGVMSTPLAFDFYITFILTFHFSIFTLKFMGRDPHTSPLAVVVLESLLCMYRSPKHTVQLVRIDETVKQSAFKII